MSNASLKSLSPRAAQLRLRCALQRDELGEAFAVVEQRLQAIDRTLLIVRNVIVKPPVILSGIAMWLLRRRRKPRAKSRGDTAGKLRRALFWIATARRVYQMLKRA